MARYRSPRYEEERKRKRRKAIMMRILVGIMLAAILFGLFIAVRAAYRKIHGWVDSVMNDPLLETTTVSPTREEETVPPSTEAPVERYRQEILSAERLALSYDYDAAISTLQELPGYSQSEELKAIVQDYLGAKSLVYKQDISQTCHLYFHSLIVDPSLAFSPLSGLEDRYNQNRITVTEFRKILQQLYDNGYVLVSLHQLAAVDEFGNFSAGQVYLPEGKKPLVLSVDDVQYYEEDRGHGFASRLVLDAESRPVCEYSGRDKETLSGEYDVVPILEAFVEQHPDFSYRGAKGCLALTGYEGILGYRTAALYGNPSDPDYRSSYASIDVEQERAEAKKVCDRLKELGWELACHTWGHINLENADITRIQADTQRWQTEVASLTGKTDILIFTSGTDIGNWRNYSSEDNEKYAFFKAQGFRYFCPVDSYTIPWVQYNASEGYLRQGRVPVNGFSLAYRKEKLAVFFDADSVFDTERPTPVPGY